MRPIVIAVSVLVALAASTFAAAGSASRTFGVNILLTQPGFGLLPSVEMLPFARKGFESAEPVEADDVDEVDE